jgi:hypothetical protein
MLSDRHPLLGANGAQAQAASDPAPTKRPYCTPELRELGPVAELTYGGSGGGPFDGSSYDSA